MERGVAIGGERARSRREGHHHREQGAGEAKHAFVSRGAQEMLTSGGPVTAFEAGRPISVSGVAATMRT